MNKIKHVRGNRFYSGAFSPILPELDQMLLQESNRELYSLFDNYFWVPAMEMSEFLSETSLTRQIGDW